MWNPNSVAVNTNTNCQDEDDSWEVKAFAEDTRNAMGTTWPPRSYTCTFCKREFRSAQALGGHMNVHRRDRARLHHVQPNGPNGLNLVNHPNAATSSSLLIPTQDLVTTGGLCLLYSLPKPNAMFDPSSFNNVKSNPSTFLSVSPHPNVNPPAVTPQSFSSSVSHSSYTEASTSVHSKSNEKVSTQKKRRKSDSVIEGIDLELRLGCSSFGF